MVQVVTVYEEHRKVQEAVEKGYLPWECLYCRQRMVVQGSDKYTAYCTSCGARYSSDEKTNTNGRG